MSGGNNPNYNVKDVTRVGKGGFLETDFGENGLWSGEGDCLLS